VGEKSKTIGELGENIYSEMVKIFGWSEAPNISINCNKRDKHNKTTHGIDSLVIHKNPLIADETEIGVVSVKNIKAGNYKSNFKNYANDVINTSVCFMRSATSGEYLGNRNTKRITEKQLLFWITNNENDNHSTIREIINTYPSTKEDYNQLIVADNRIVSFHYDLRKFVDATFKNPISIEYFYPNTGLNETINELRLLQGKELPIDWITSPIIPYRINLKDDKNVLVLGLNEAFEEDSFKRLIGLSQNLTSGWCNKIILCFPDYRYQEHKSIKEKVLLQIADKDFSNLIEVASFNPNFQSLEEHDKDYFKNIENKAKEPQDFNIERMLPYGDTLRQLLIQPYINKTDIVRILNRRGIFVKKSLKKTELIPILSTSFISPSELEYLRKCQSSRANSERISSSNIVTSNEEAVHESVISCNIPLEKIVKEISPNTDLASVTKFAVHEDGSIRLKLKTKSHNISKGWAKSNTNNTTEIVINKATSHGKNAKARIDIIASSDENKKIGQQIVKHIEDAIKNDGNLRHDFTLEKTLANEFTHQNRADLLFTFFKKEVSENFNISFKDLTNVDFVITDPSDKALKDDLLTLKDKVERSIFSGRNLQEIKYINDPKYYDFLIFTEVIADFNFEYEEMKGNFEVQYGFPDYDPIEKIDKSEFEFKITRVTPFIEHNLTNKENHNLETYLKNEFGKLKQEVIGITNKKYGRQGKLFE
jgi:hypothetical protein